MAPDPPDKFSSNRFSVLGDYIECRPKKQKLTDYPDLPIPQSSNNNNNGNPKYVVISSTDPKKPLSTLSPFAIKKGIECISTEYTSITSLRDGNLLILMRNTRAADKLIKAKSLANLCPISCKFHDTLNFVKGVIYAPCLINVPEQEIVQEMKSQGVTSVYKFTKPGEDGNSRIPSGKIILTFDLYRLPSSVDVAWYKCKVDHYIPNPMRCKNCQKLGHTKNRCNGNTTCPTCSLPPHNPEKCTRTLCTNCSGEHSSADNNCPRYIQLKEILKIKTRNYCSLSEARRKYRENNPIQTAHNNSYASMASGPLTLQKPNSNKQPINNTNSPSANNVSENHPTQTPLQPKVNTPSTSRQITQSNVKESAQTNNINKLSNLKSQKNIISTENIYQKQNISIVDKFKSPISNLTQSLLAKNNYYIPKSDEEDSDETSMDIHSP